MFFGKLCNSQHIELPLKLRLHKIQDTPNMSADPIKLFSAEKLKNLYPIYFQPPHHQLIKVAIRA
jgi:hypothetical protein